MPDLWADVEDLLTKGEGVQVIDGATDIHLWSQSFTEPVDDVITTQAVLADTIVAALQNQRGRRPG